MRSWSLKIFGAKQGYEQVAEKGDGDNDESDVFQHLFEPFACAEIENRGGEEDDGCDREDGVVHERRIWRACLGSGQRWIRISLEKRKSDAMKQRGNELTMEFGAGLGCHRRLVARHVPKWDEEGYTPVCFLKSMEVFLNQRVADGPETRVCRRLKRRGLRSRAFRRGASSHTSITDVKVLVNNDLVDGNSNQRTGYSNQCASECSDSLSHLL